MLQKKAKTGMKKTRKLRYKYEKQNPSAKCRDVKKHRC